MAVEITLSRRLKKLTKNDAWRVREYIARGTFVKPSEKKRKEQVRVRFRNGHGERAPKYRVRALDGTVYTPFKTIEGRGVRYGEESFIVTAGKSFEHHKGCEAGT